MSLSTSALGLFLCSQSALWLWETGEHYLLYLGTVLMVPWDLQSCIRFKVLSSPLLAYQVAKRLLLVAVLVMQPVVLWCCGVLHVLGGVSHTAHCLGFPYIILKPFFLNASSWVCSYIHKVCIQRYTVILSAVTAQKGDLSSLEATDQYTHSIVIIIEIIKDGELLSAVSNFEVRSWEVSSVLKK